MVSAFFLRAFLSAPMYHLQPAVDSVQAARCGQQRCWQVDKGTSSGSTRAPGLLQYLALLHLLSPALVHQIVEVVLVNFPFHLLQLQDSNARPYSAM